MKKIEKTKTGLEKRNGFIPQIGETGTAYVC